MRLLYDHSEEVAAFVSSQIPLCAKGFRSHQSIGVIDADGRLVAGLSWYNWDPSAGVIEFSCASITPRWMTRAIRKEMFVYPFEGLDAQLIVAITEASNFRVHRLLEVMGFSRTDLPRIFGRMRDGVLWTLTDEEWRSNAFYQWEKRTMIHLPRQIQK